MPTDNNVVSGLGAVIKVAESKKIPLIAAEGDSVKNGAVITYGLDYEKLGYQTGEMAVRILKGEAKPETMPVEAQKDRSCTSTRLRLSGWASPFPPTCCRRPRR